MTGLGSNMGDPVREVLATADGLRVQLVTINSGQRIPWHIHTSVSDTIIAVTGLVDVEVASEGHHLLQPGERTASMPYHEEKPNKDLAPLSSGISVFYLKPSKNDLPLRIETLDPDVDHAASVILALSAISDSYAYPAILVEADMCAAMDGREMESIEASLISFSGMKPLRRNSRPFR